MISKNYFEQQESPVLGEKMISLENDYYDSINNTHLKEQRQLDQNLINDFDNFQKENDQYERGGIGLTDSKKWNILSSKRSQDWLRKRYCIKGNINYLWRSREVFQKQDIDDLFSAVQARSSSKCRNQGCIQSEALYQVIKETNNLDKKTFMDIMTLVDRDRTGYLGKDQFHALLLSKTIHNYFIKPNNPSGPQRPPSNYSDYSEEKKKIKLPHVDFSRAIGQSKYQMERAQLVNRFEDIRRDKDVDIEKKCENLKMLLAQKNFNIDHIGISPCQQTLLPISNRSQSNSRNITPLKPKRYQISGITDDKLEILPMREFNSERRENSKKTTEEDQQRKQNFESIDRDQYGLQQYKISSKSSRKHSTGSYRSIQISISPKKKERYVQEIDKLVGKAKEKGQLLAERLPTEKLIYEQSAKIIDLLKQQQGQVTSKADLGILDKQLVSSPKRLLKQNENSGNLHKLIIGSQRNVFKKTISNLSQLKIQHSSPSLTFRNIQSEKGSLSPIKIIGKKQISYN